MAEEHVSITDDVDVIADDDEVIADEHESMTDDALSIADDPVSRAHHAVLIHSRAKPMTETHARIESLLRAHFAPERLDVVDESAQHAGHAGGREHGGAHFAVTLVSAAFEGRSSLERHRMVYAALGDEMKAAVHALALTTRTPAEAQGR